MRTDWKEWLQILSNLAILVGIALVLLELRQNQLLTTVQLRSEGDAIQADFANSLMGESPQAILEKACLHHSELTPQDKIVLAQIFQNRLTSAVRNRFIEQTAGLDLNYENSLRQAFTAIVNYEYGREFVKRMEEFIPADSDIREAADTALARSRPSDCAVGSVIPGGF